MAPDVAPDVAQQLASFRLSSLDLVPINLLLPAHGGIVMQRVEPLGPQAPLLSKGGQAAATAALGMP